MQSLIYEISFKFKKQDKWLHLRSGLKNHLLHLYKQLLCRYILGISSVQIYNKKPVTTTNKQTKHYIVIFFNCKSGGLKRLYLIILILERIDYIDIDFTSNQINILLLFQDF